MSVRSAALAAAFLALLFAGCPKAPRTDPDRAPAEATDRSDDDATPEPPPHEAGPAADVGPRGPDAAGPEARSDLPSPPPFAPSAISWTMEPPELEVMRDTRVALTATLPPDAPASCRCTWNPGDNTGPLHGCDVEHPFLGGLSDRTVTLEVTCAARTVLKESRPLPVERLPVYDLPSGPRPVPPPPPDGKGSRVAFVALFAPPDEPGLDRIAAALEASGTSLALLFINYPLDRPAAEMLLTGLNDGRNWTALPVYCDPAAAQAAGSVIVRSARVLDHGTANAPPFRYAFLADGIGFVMLDPRAGSYDLDQEKWLLDQLTSLSVATHRIVISCRPMERLTTTDRGSLEPQFRYYEKLMRGDTSLLVSSTYPVYYAALYGRLPVASAGAATGTPDHLLGARNPQPNLLLLADFIPATRPVLYPVEPATPQTAFDDTSFPFKVGNYLRSL